MLTVSASVSMVIIVGKMATGGSWAAFESYSNPQIGGGERREERERKREYWESM